MFKLKVFAARFFTSESFWYLMLLLVVYAAGWSRALNVWVLAAVAGIWVLMVLIDAWAMTSAGENPYEE